MRRLIIALACTLITGTTHAQTRYVYQQCPNGHCPQQQVRYYYPVQVQPQVPQAQPTVVQASYTQTTATTTTTGDPYGFTNWLNGIRGQYGLGAVVWDTNLANAAIINSSYGYGHIYRYGRRQNAGQGALQTILLMWMASPAHRAALLDPSITHVGLGQSGNIFTFEGN